MMITVGLEQAVELIPSEYQEVGCETVFSRNGCINKAGTLAISMDKGTRKGRDF